MLSSVRRLFGHQKNPQAVTGLSWALLTVTLLCVRSGIINPLLVGVLLLISLSMLLRLHQPFGHSNSTKTLLGRARNAAAGSSRLLHRIPILRQVISKPRTPWYWYALGGLIATGLGIGVGVYAPAMSGLLLLSIAFGYAYVCRTTWLQILTLAGVYSLLHNYSVTVTAVDLALLVLVVILAVAWYQRQWILLIPAIIGGYLIASQTMPEMLGSILVMATIYGVTAVFVPLRRLADQRELVRSLLILTYAPGVLLLLTYAPNLVGATILLSLGAAILAWRQYGNDSYAKYFFQVALYLFLTILALILSPGWLVLALLLTSFGLVLVGSRLNSYTLRLAGLGVLAVGIAVYIVEILPVSPTTQVEAALNRIGLGALLALSLPIYADWYLTLPLLAVEKRMLSWLQGIFPAFSALLLFCLILLETEAWLQSSLLIVLSLLVWIVAKKRRLGKLVFAAQVTLIAAFFALISADSLLLPTMQMYLIWVCAALFASSFPWWSTRLVQTHFT